MKTSGTGAVLFSAANSSQPHRYLIETNPALTDLRQFLSSATCSTAWASTSTSLLTHLFSETSADESAPEREAKRNVIASLVTGIAGMTSPSTAGSIIEVRPSKAGDLNVYENGITEPGQVYHQVYTDGQYVYDPRLSSNPVPKGDWEQHIKNINPGGISISDKLKGLR